MIRRLIFLLIFLAAAESTALQMGFGENQRLAPLIKCLVNGDEKMALTLLAAGADPNEPTKEQLVFGSFLMPEKTFPLHIVASSPHEFSGEIVNRLIAMRANVDERNGGGETAILLAAGSEKVQVVRALLGNCANPKLASYKDEKPLHAAAVLYQPFLAKGMDWGKRLEITDALLKAGAHPGQAGSMRSVLGYLMHAIITNNQLRADDAYLPLVERLLQNADPRTESEVKGLVEGYEDLLPLRLTALVMGEWPREAVQNADKERRCCGSKVSFVSASVALLWAGYTGMLIYLIV